ncbi:MAG: hypothetical protein R3236_10120, partial [Phycisphaeraceae bacterium]|nr:hypothetical protein [Phycisphaeraceae bacterium]
MPEPALAHDLTLQLVVMLGAGCLGCWCASKISLSPTAGGLLAGLLIGPALAALAPGLHNDLWNGTGQHRQRLQEAQAAWADAREQLALRIEGLKASGVTESYWKDARQSGEAELKRMRERTIEPIRRRIEQTAGRRHDGRRIAL